MGQRLQEPEKYHPTDYRVRRATYTVSVRNLSSEKTDTKDFSIAAFGESKHEMCEIIKGFCERDLVPQFEDDFVQFPATARKMSHQILVIEREGTSRRSVAFRINIPHSYSSEDVARCICKYLCKGKCDF